MSPQAYIDTNVLVRALTLDSPVHSVAARELLDRAHRREIELLLTETTLAELEWVLRSVYRYTREAISRALAAIVAAEGMVVEQPEVARGALELYARSDLDFTDALLGARAVVRGPPIVCSFDRDFEDVPGLRRLDPGQPP